MLWILPKCMRNRKRRRYGAGVKVGKWSVDPVLLSVQPFERICAERCDGRCCSIGGVETSLVHIQDVQRHHPQLDLPPERFQMLDEQYAARKVLTGWQEIPYNPENDQCLYFNEGCTIWRLKQELAPLYCVIFPLMVFNGYVTLHPSAFTYCLKANAGADYPLYTLFGRELEKILGAELTSFAALRQVK